MHAGAAQRPAACLLPRHRAARPALLPTRTLPAPPPTRPQLVFYGSYHSNPLNQAIHFVFVPAIWWTVAVWLAYTPAVSPGDLGFLASRLPGWAAAAAPYLPYLRLNASALLAAAYSLYYVALTPLAGLSWAGAAPLGGRGAAGMAGRSIGGATTGGLTAAWASLPSSLCTQPNMLR